LMSFAAFGIVAKPYIWPNLPAMGRDAALVALIVPHTFRFVGLSFLFPGVVSPSLPSAFAMPAAFGDLIAAVLAIISILALKVHWARAMAIVCVFNSWGAADLLFAVYQGQIGARIDAGALGAAFFIPTLVVPPLLILHGLVFRVLLSSRW
jgi:hypothetical protein